MIERSMRNLLRAAATLAAFALMSGCTTPTRTLEPARRPADVRAEIVRLMPASASDRDGWARDIAAAFAALAIEPDTHNICATLAVAEQESNFVSDPPVPGLGRIARAEIDRRAAQHNVPLLLVRGALMLDSPN